LLNLGQTQTLTAQPNNLRGETVAFGGRLAARAVDQEKLFEIGLAGEVADDGANRVGVQVETLGELLGGGAIQIVGFADLVVAMGDQGGLAEQVSQMRGAGHGSWVEKRQGNGAKTREAALASDEGIEAPGGGGQEKRQAGASKDAAAAERHAEHK